MAGVLADKPGDAEGKTDGESSDIVEVGAGVHGEACVMACPVTIRQALVKMRY